MFWDYRSETSLAKELEIRTGTPCQIEASVKGGLIDLRVSDDKGDPLANFRVTFINASTSAVMGNWTVENLACDAHYAARRDSLLAGEGRMEVPIPAGKYMLVVGHEGAQDAAVNVEVEEGKRALAEVRLTLRE